MTLTHPESAPSTGTDGPLARYACSASELQERQSVERGGDAYLVYRDGCDRQQIVALRGCRERLIVGRGDAADVRLVWDEEVSRTHAELVRIGDAWTVIDDGLSTNGTLCNDERVRGRRRLRDGDLLRIGRTLVAFRVPAATNTAGTVRAATIPRVTLTDSQRRVLIALCRPLSDNAHATPATNQQIGAEVYLGVDAVKVHLRALCRKLGIEPLPQNEKRARLAQLALRYGIVEH